MVDDKIQSDLGMFDSESKDSKNSSPNQNQKKRARDNFAEGIDDLASERIQKDAGDAADAMKDKMKSVKLTEQSKKLHDEKIIQVSESDTEAQEGSRAEASCSESMDLA